MNKIMTIGDLMTDNIIRYAINSNKNFNFDKLKLAYPKLGSMTQFIELFKKQQIKITGRNIENNTDLLYICCEALKQVEPEIKTEQKKIIVTKHFIPKLNKDKFKTEIHRKVAKLDGEIGKSQNEQGKEWQLDLSSQNWYIYNDNYGTSEEKYFVKWFSGFVNTLIENNWSDIYLARNDKAVKIYSWLPDSLGDGFEPDFVLFMKKDNIEYCFYIEPKGEHLLLNDKWKEELLFDIENVVLAQQATESANKNWRVMGLSFYNETAQTNTGTKKQEFEDAFKSKTIE